MKQFTNGFVGGLATLDLQRDQTSSNMDGGEVGKGPGREELAGNFRNLTAGDCRAAAARSQ